MRCSHGRAGSLGREGGTVAMGEEWLRCPQLDVPRGRNFVGLFFNLKKYRMMQNL